MTRRDNKYIKILHKPKRKCIKLNKMHELLTVVENGEIHFQITKNENVPIVIESFNYNEYGDALKRLRQLNNN